MFSWLALELVLSVAWSDAKGEGLEHVKHVQPSNESITDHSEAILLLWLLSATWYCVRMKNSYPLCCLYCPVL